MCGRYTLRASPRQMALTFRLDSMHDIKPRYNIAPTQQVPVVRSAADGSRELVELRWGLIPSWASDPSIGSRLINARSETAAVKPAFRTAMRQRRCLIPADGFYEWQKHGPHQAADVRPLQRRRAVRLRRPVGKLARCTAAADRNLHDFDHSRQRTTTPAARANADHSSPGELRPMARPGHQRSRRARTALARSAARPRLASGQLARQQRAHDDPSCIALQVQKSLWE